MSHAKLSMWHFGSYGLGQISRFGYDGRPKFLAESSLSNAISIVAIEIGRCEPLAAMGHTVAHARIWRV
jgi:hypothetical protein